MRFLLALILSASCARAAIQISLTATQFTLPNPWTYSTDSDSPEGAWVAPLHTQSSISATVSLGQVLPPGNYAIFLKCLDYDRGNSNLLVLNGITGGFNIFDDRDTVTGYWSTNVQMTVATPSPVASSIIVSFYSGSVGDPHQLRWFAMYITSDTSEIVTREDRAIRYSLVNTVDSTVTAGNKIPNSSFEGGISRFWRINSSGANVPRTFTLQDCLETSFGYHGGQCMRLPTRTNTVALFQAMSNPIMCASNRIHSLSVMAKSSFGTNSFNMYIASFYAAPSGYTATFTTNTAQQNGGVSRSVTNEWTRIELTNVFLPFYPNGQYYLILETRAGGTGGVNGGGFTYIDQVQFEEGVNVTTYAPQNAYEVGPTLSERTQVVWTNQTPTILLRAFNNGGSGATKQVDYSMLDWTNGIVISGSTNMTAGAGSAATATITVPVTKKGHFRFVTSIAGQTGDDELTFVIVNPVSSFALDTNSFFGGHVNADTNALWRNQRLGMKKQRGLSLGRVRWSEVELTDGVFTWPSDLEFYTNAGVAIMLNLGENNPSWISPVTDNTNYIARFVTNVLDHYRGLIWAIEIWNEPNQDTPEIPNLAHYANLLSLAADAAKAFDASVVVVGGGGLSTYQMVTNVWALCGTHTNHIDAMSVHLYPPNEFSASDLNAFTAVPLMNTETGSPDKGAYTLANYPFRFAGRFVTTWKDGDAFYDAYWNTIRDQAKNLLTCLAFGIKEQFYYDMGQRNITPPDSSSVQYSTPDYDDCPKPKAAMLSGVFSLLDKCSGKKQWTFGSETAFGYLRGTTPLVAVWGSSNKTATFTGVTTNELLVYDVMGNGRKPDSLAIPFGRMPLIIEGQGITLATLSNAVVAATVTGRTDAQAPRLIKYFPKSHETVDGFRWMAIDDSGVPNEENPDTIQYRYQIGSALPSPWGQVTEIISELASLPVVKVQARDASGNITGDIIAGTNIVSKAKGVIKIVGGAQIK